MGAGDLSAALWQERRQLELLLFRLETQRLHVLAGNLQWLSFTASEVENVLGRLRFEALARSVESAAVAAEWGLPAQATLVELVAGAPSGAWPDILQAHLDGLRALLRQLGETAGANEETLRHLDVPGGSGASPGPDVGDAEAAITPPGDSAESLDQLTTEGNIEHALAVTRRATQPTLLQFLGGNGD